MSSRAREACSSPATRNQSGAVPTAWAGPVLREIDTAGATITLAPPIALPGLRAAITRPVCAGWEHSLCPLGRNELALIARSVLILAILLRRRKNPMSRILDRLDRRILDELQQDARMSNQELARRVGLSPAPCWRRLRRLEEAGFITGYATLLDGATMGLPILAYALVSLENHHPETVRQFDQLVRDRPEVLECHSMS